MSPILREPLDVPAAWLGEREQRTDRWMYHVTASDMQFLKNSVNLHARTDYEDYDEPERKRHLLRLWLTAHEFPDGNEMLRGGIPKKEGVESNGVTARG